MTKFLFLQQGGDIGLAAIEKVRIFWLWDAIQPGDQLFGRGKQGTGFTETRLGLDRLWLVRVLEAKGHGPRRGGAHQDLVAWVKQPGDGEETLEMEIVRIVLHARARPSSW